MFSKRSTAAGRNVTHTDEGEDDQDREDYLREYGHDGDQPSEAAHMFICFLCLRRLFAERDGAMVFRERASLTPPYVTPESYSTFDYPLMLLTELAVGLGPSSAPGAAAPFAPKPHGCLFCSHTARLGSPLPRPLGRGIKLAKNWWEYLG